MTVSNCPGVIAGTGQFRGFTNPHDTCTGIKIYQSVLVVLSLTLFQYAFGLFCLVFECNKNSSNDNENTAVAAATTTTAITRFFFYKNRLYKNTQAEILPKK